MTTTNDIAKQQLAGGIAYSIRHNVDRLYAGAINDATFDQIQRGAWMLAESEGVADLVRSLLIDAGK